MEHAIILPLAVLAAGILRGVTGFGFALAAVPILSLFVEPLFAVILAQMLQIAQSPFDFLHNRRDIDFKALGLLFAGTVVGAPIGAYFATRLDPDIMRLTVAVFVVLGLIVIMRRVTFPPGAGPALSSGVLAGLLAGLAAMPGPPAVAYFLGRGVDKAVSRASLLLFFAGTASVVLVSMMLTSDAVTFEIFKAACLGLPALLLGTYLGTQLFLRLNDEGYRTVAMAILFVSALMTGFKGLQGLL